MAYDEKLASRIRKALGTKATEKRMFGGIAFMVRGHMACGVTKERLMVRTGPLAYETALKKPHARPMDFTGKPIKGMVFVLPEGTRTAAQVKVWVKLALKFNATQTAK
ncbi:MAG: TfoX/Sxy family protein [Planctomycetes bacterium]|nr:TfoX/Sxy family protein [Planctomycetota bacterium]